MFSVDIQCISSSGLLCEENNKQNFIFSLRVFVNLFDLVGVQENNEMNRILIIYFFNWEYVKLEINFRILWGVVQSN